MQSKCTLLGGLVISSYLFATETSSSTEYTERIDPTPRTNAVMRTTPREILISPVRFGYAIHNQCASFVFDGWERDSGIVTVDEVLHQTVNMNNAWSIIIR